MDDLRRVCFFCNKVIEEKKTLEHIIPNSLLGKLTIKEETITGRKKTQYSRIKVPAHSSCNSEFGSEYESRVLALLEDVESLYEAIKSEELGLPLMYGPDQSVSSIITTWLSKIYYGLFYYDLISTQDQEWKDICLSIVKGRNFEFVRTSYKNGYGFQLPSSLYVFKTKNTNTDLVTLVEPSSILLKIGTLTFILCICDGYLTKNYLNGESLERLRECVRHEDESNVEFPSHKLALGEIAALRSCIPKTPKFISSDNQIINMSLSTMVANPEEYYSIDKNELFKARVDILREFNIKLD
ncbi:MAG: HNH endonuclease [Gammaproteobacteria bacterium]|nr:HNH endonuclease [Gammaproteobacteria bacterium]MBU2059142.1 HNH endonuclease [Gammaproteobacteria bacterium]MBU2173693.1 HNH endonuclease [Gammaproteobacteria bacterium]MBU2246849.1 HNH endonuclease [Gammaproteobacteria bacterium]MBU2343419.1 HNH endonuclease [Gammaproteobacteria bacterium]